MLLFRQKYPRWWFDWNLQLSRFLARVWVYAALLRDEYPSTDEEQAVHLDFPYPDATQLSRGLPLVKWFLAIPHYIVLFFLWIGAVVSDHHRLVRHPLHRQVPTGSLRLRGRRAALVAAGLGVRHAADHRPVPAVQPLRIARGAAQTLRTRPKGESIRESRCIHSIWRAGSASPQRGGEAGAEGCEASRTLSKSSRCRHARPQPEGRRFKPAPATIRKPHRKAGLFF